MQQAKRATRRRHDADLKQRILAECDEPSASVAQVALSHGLNANLVHKWRRGVGHARSTASDRQAEFVPVTVARETPDGPPIRIELRRGATTVNVAWPLSAAGHCAGWLRELLR